jgi:hypothetical protein
VVSFWRGKNDKTLAFTIVVGDSNRRSDPVRAVMEAKSPQHTSKKDKEMLRTNML